jgi:hypothetical protein
MKSVQTGEAGSQCSFKRDEIHPRWLICMKYSSKMVIWFDFWIVASYTTYVFRLFLYEKNWCASRARVNLPHIGKKTCIKFDLYRNLLKMQRTTFLSRNLNVNKTQGLTFLVEICMGDTLRMSNFKTVCNYFRSWTPK